jgi:hypothetical protein
MIERLYTRRYLHKIECGHGLTYSTYVDETPLITEVSVPLPANYVIYFSP